MSSFALNERQQVDLAAEGRRDPLLHSPFKVGDMVTFCAICGTAHLEATWGMFGKCVSCGCQSTSSEFPQKRGRLRFGSPRVPVGVDSRRSAGHWGFVGRVSRRQFIIRTLSALGSSILVLVATVMAESVKDESYRSLIGLLALAMYGAVVWYLFATTVKRLHDLGGSGWHLLFLLVPYAYLVVLPILLFVKGNSTPNRFGPVP